MRIIFILFLITMSFFSLTVSKDITFESTTDYSKEISYILMSKENYSTNKEIKVENNFATYVSDSSPFTGKYVEFQKNNVESIKSFKNGI